MLNVLPRTESGVRKQKFNKYHFAAVGKPLSWNAL